MARPLSQDLRARVASALAKGATTRSVAQRFGVSISSAVRIGRKQRSGAGLSPGKIGGHRPFILTGEAAEWLRARLVGKRDLTMRALTGELAARGIVVARDTVWRFVRREGLTFKKNRVRKRAGQAKDSTVPHALAKASAPA